jgi:hypothetical protein
MAKQKEDRMLTTAEAAEILDVSPASIRVWLSEDGHPRFPNARRFGHVWQIPESDLEGQPRGRKRGRPPKPADTDEGAEAADEAKPTHRASKRSSAKKANVTKSAKKAKKGATAK